MSGNSPFLHIRDEPVTLDHTFHLLAHRMDCSRFKNDQKGGWEKFFAIAYDMPDLSECMLSIFTKITGLV